VPAESSERVAVKNRLDAAVDYLEQEIRSTLQEMIAAAPYALWLAATPVVSFVLLTSAPGFQRSALRVLPRGHLRWRGEEYLRDVNSALAGYVRAQTAAGVLVGLMCVTGFVLLGLPSAVSMGVAAGVLELVPAIGPLTVMVVVATQAGDLGLARAALPSGPPTRAGLHRVPAPGPPRDAPVDARGDPHRSGSARRWQAPPASSWPSRPPGFSRSASAIGASIATSNASYVRIPTQRAP
jgi:hypothetical protein